MCDVDRFRILTPEALRRQEDVERAVDGEEIHCNHATTSPARSVSNASRSMGTTPKTGTVSRQNPAMDTPAEPDSKLEAGNKLPHKLGDYFPVKEMAGKPLEEIDDYYASKKSFVVIAGDKTIFRFSTTNALFLLSPFNPIRRAAIYVLVHPVFSFIILLAIIVNCIFMAMPKFGTENPQIEYAFTAIYTVEAVIKIIARGMILSDFTYLRDAWNWLDFVVVSLAYFMFFSDALSNVSALRTLRVLRALKTVTTVPGLKTIVGALLEAVKRLRDVMVLTIFVLSIFALVGLQIYRGTLLRKCVKIFNATQEGYDESGMTAEERLNLTFLFYNNEANWLEPRQVCKNVSADVRDSERPCPKGYICIQTKTGNPNFNYTNFDNFGYAFLSAFRLMTQDAWENLYQIVIKANGMIHVIYFILVILLGSFYLMNVILAIVAMSYDEVKMQNQADEEEEEAEKKEEEEMREQILENVLHKSPSELSNLSYMELYCLSDIAQRRDDKRVEELSLHSERFEGGPRPRYFSIKKRRTCSIPGTPIARRLTAIRSPADKSPADGSPDDSESEAPTVQPPVHPSRHRQHSEGDSLPPLVPFFDDSNAQSPIDIPDCLSAFALTSGRRVWHSPVLPTKTAMLDRLASNATPMEARLYRTMLNHSPLMPRRDDEMDGLKYSPHFGQRLMPQDGSVRRKRSRGPSIQSSAVELNDVVILKALVDDTIGQHKCSLPNLAEQEKLPLKDVILRWFLTTLCGWTCCPFWLKIEKIVSYIILDAFVELFITLCILANTALMALDTPFKSPQLDAFLKATNYFFTATFALEALLKLIALRPNVYFKEGWNIFDFFIVILSFVEMPLANVKGLSIFRSFRLLRVLKLAKSWNTMNLLFAIIGRTIGALGNLIFVLGIIVFIFAVVGMQLFGEAYKNFRNETLYPELKGEGLRWHFEDFLHSFMIVFRVLCGEWIESMWNCMRVNGWKCVPFFLLTEIIASLVVLNLFLALLISSFGSESLQRREETEEPNKLEEAVDRIIRFVTWTKLHLRKFWLRFSRPLTSKFRRKRNLGATVISSPQDDEVPRGVKSELDLSLPPGLRIQIENGGMNKESDDEDDYKKSTGNLVNRTVVPLSESLKNRSPTFDEEPEVNEVEIVYCSTPDDCLPTICTTKLCPGLYERISASRFGQIWWKVRCKAYLAVEHRYFESFIIFMILLSSSTLTLEDVYLKERHVLKKTLEVMDKIFTVIFTLEMLLKWVAFGMKKYFKDAWCWLDFTIVSIALFSLLLNALGGDAAKNMQAFKAMRTLRALRPLRAVSRWEGMRVVVNALIQSVPSIFNVLLVILVFWLIFSIMGVQLFGGRFFKCMDANKSYVIQDEFYWHRDNCTSHAELYGNVTWINSKINFDNIFNGYLALFQVATYKGWIEIMADATDITDIHHQPKRENKVILYLYFVMFIIIGSFFTLNLFIGVIIDNFNVQKKKAGGSIEIFMTDEQKKYYKAMKKMDSTSLQKPIPKPKFKIGKIFYYIVHHQTFDIVIMVFIMLNTFVMCIEYHDQSPLFNNVLKYVNTIFVAIFTGECVFKLIALRLHYFKFPWNVFDFVIVIFSIVCMCMEDIMKAINFSPTLIRIVRVFRIGRVLRLVKSARGIRTLLFSLFVSLPALINIALLLIMIMFIYAMVGMSFFASVPYHSGIDYMFNFQTFPKSMMVLFQMCTSAGWSGVLEGLSNNPECEKKENQNKCPNYALAVSYLCSYLMISFLVIVNMYIAVILENFSQATEDVQQGLTQDDFDIFYEKWENYDLKARGYIKLEQVYDFLDEVDPPLGLFKPNRVKLALLEVPIREDDVIYSVDLLDKLTRNFLGTPAEDEDVSKVSGPKEKAKEKRPVISNTLLRQREHVAAQIITCFIRNCAKNNRARNGLRSNSVYPNSPRRENLVEVTSESRAVV